MEDAIAEWKLKWERERERGRVEATITAQGSVDVEYSRAGCYAAGIRGVQQKLAEEEIDVGAVGYDGCESVPAALGAEAAKGTVGGCVSADTEGVFAHLD